MRQFTKGMSAVALTLAVASVANAAPYASGIINTGSSVSFVLNEPTDSLTVSINGGAPIVLDGSTKGTKTFAVSSLTDTFVINAYKTDTVGYTIPTGATIATAANGLSQPTNAAGLRLLSDDTNVLTRFNSPRGIAVNNNPNAGSFFGTAYVANSAGGSTAAVAGVVAARTLGDGLYALKADQSDGLGYGDTAQTGGITNWASAASASAPFRLSTGSDNNVYISDFSDTTGTVWRMGPSLTGGVNMLNVVGGPSAVPNTQNHGSTTAVYVTGSAATGDLSIYTLDEDLTSATAGVGASTTDKNSLWRYDLGSATSGFAGAPVKVNASNVLLPAATSDLDRGADGKFYLAQNRSAGGEAGVVVLDASGVKLYDSLSDSRTILGDSAAKDILRNVLGMAVSLDQSWMALLLNNSDVAVLPLIDGIPDLANRMVVDTGADINSGRDIAFDAAGNIHYVSSGQGYYKILSPGGTTVASTSWDGSNYAFAVSVPEPTTVSVLGMGVLGLAARRRRMA